jgi:hypothetical protein
MTTPLPDQHLPGPPSAQQPESTVEQVMLGRVHRRRERVYASVQQARRGDHKIPTWVLATALGLILLGWLYLIFFG